MWSRLMQGAYSHTAEVCGRENWKPCNFKKMSFVLHFLRSNVDWYPNDGTRPKIKYKWTLLAWSELRAFHFI
jgi:hypothetical protein